MQRPATVLAATLSLMIGTLQTGPARSQIHAPVPITTPIPDDVRAPFAAFLRESLQVADPEPLLAQALGTRISGIRREHILLRLEGRGFCSGEHCLTFIGHIADGVFVAEAMFSAGKNLTTGDTIGPMFGFGFQTFARYLVSDTLTIVLWETPKGWIIGSSPGALFAK